MATIATRSTEGGEIVRFSPRALELCILMKEGAEEDDNNTTKTEGENEEKVLEYPVAPESLKRIAEFSEYYVKNPFSSEEKEFKGNLKWYSDFINLSLKELSTLTRDCNYVQNLPMRDLAIWKIRKVIDESDLSQIQEMVGGGEITDKEAADFEQTFPDFYA